MDPTQNIQPQQAPPQTPTETPSKPRSKKNKILIASLAALLLIVAGVTGFLLMNKEDSSGNEGTSTTGTESTNIDVSTLTTELQQKYTQELAEIGAPPGVSVGQVSDESIGTGKPSGYSFYVSSGTGAKGFRIIDNEGGTDYTPEGEERRYSTYQAISPEIASYMKERGFTSETIILPGDPRQIDTYIYVKSNVVCNQDLQNFSCIEAKSLEDDAKRLDPFIELVKNNPDLPNPFVASIYQDRITQDGANGYKTAEIFVSPEKFNFYQRKSGEWKFVGAFGTQDIPECKEYGTDPEALKAFEGEDCYDSLPSGQQDIKKLGE